LDDCQGSGCIISEDGLIFTAKHITDGDLKDYVVTLDDGRKYPVVDVLEVKNFDVAFLKIEPNEPLPYARLADLKKIRIGDPLFIIGSPHGFSNLNSVTLGILSGTDRVLEPWMIADEMYRRKVVFQSDAAAYPGSSGSPVFNIKGEVLGILVSGIDDNLNYSVPVSVFMYDIDIIKLAFRLNRFEPLENKAEDYPMIYTHSFE